MHPILRGKRILILVAHPDDESLYFFGGLKNLSKHSSLTVLSATYTAESHRAQEMKSACRFMGIKCDFLGLEDFGFYTLLDKFEQKLEKYISENQFDLIITHPPHGGEKAHPHHLHAFLVAFFCSLKAQIQFGFFSECGQSLCENLSNGILHRLKAIPLLFLYTAQTFPYLNWKSRLKWIQTFGKRLYHLCKKFYFQGLYFRRFEFESPVDEKKQALNHYTSQREILNSYRTSTSDREYLFFLKKLSPTGQKEKSAEDSETNPLKTFYQNPPTYGNQVGFF